MLPPIAQSYDFTTKDGKGNKGHFSKVIHQDKCEKPSGDYIWYSAMLIDDLRMSVPLQDDAKTNKTAL